MRTLFRFIWILWTVAAPASAMECGSVFATLVLTPAEASSLSGAALAQRGESAFRLAEQIKRTPLADRADGGRRLDIPRDLRDAIVNRAETVLRAEAEGEGADIIAKGNLGHQGDHTDLYQLNNTPSSRFARGAYADLFGVRGEDVYLAKIVHDLGKLPSTKGTAHIREYISGKTNQDFLKTRILGHGFDSIARIAELVQEEGNRLGTSKKDQLRTLLQLADAISWHNYGPSTDRATARSRYKSLTDGEVDVLVNAFWPTFFNNGLKTPDGKVLVTPFAADLGIAPYGSSADRSVIQKLLTIDDRAALVTENAPDKIGNQNLNVGKPEVKTFNQELIQKTFVNPAKETVVALKAMAEELQGEVIDPTFKSTDLPSYQRGMDLAAQLKATGERVLEMNSQENLANLGVGSEEAKHTLVYRDKAGLWWKVNGENKTQPALSIRVGDRWVESGDSKLSEGTAFDSLMKLLRRDSGGKLLATN